jgi:hypothetical protein
MNIWHLDNKNYTTLQLWRTDKNNYLVIQDGAYKSILTNGNYILVDYKYGNIFSQLSDHVAFHKVTIWDYHLNINTEDYIELNILNDISPASLQTIDSMGLKVWQCNGSIFVSAELKDELMKIAGNDLVFTLGFSYFA